MPGRTATLFVFLASLAILIWNAGAAGIATSYIDPVAKIHSQAEAMYAAGTFQIAEHGDWLTPRFAGRYALWKPPMLNWLSAGAVRLLGRNALALRLPSIVAGAATVTLVFWWLLVDGAPVASALTGAILLLSSHLFFMSSRIAMMDALLAFEITLAMFAVARDPRLASRACLWMFGGACGAAIMTKALAGTLPLIIVCVYWLFSREKPSFSRLVQVAGIVLAIVLPWHLYQFWRHPRWFWGEYFLTEMFSYGVDSPPQETQETQVGFYLKRLLLLDPFLLAAALAALIWKRPRLLLIWILVVFAAALAFQYRNDAYLLPMYSALAILAASAIPGASPASATSPTPVMKTRRNWATGFAILACLVFAGKVIASAQPWGIPFKPESVNPSLAALDRYAALHRGNDLLVVEPDDDFYSADIGLPHVRYVWVDPNPPRHFPLDFQYLGILISAADYSRLPELQPQFEQRLREWNLNSSDPIPTSILARNRDELAELIRTHPMADFFLTTDWIAGDQAVHQVWPANAPSTRPAEREFLLSRKEIQRP